MGNKTRNGQKSGSGKNPDKGKSGKGNDQKKKDLPITSEQNMSKEVEASTVSSQPSTEKGNQFSQTTVERSSAPRFNAFQRLLIKIGGITIPEEPDREAEEEQKKKFELLEQEIQELKDKVKRNEVIMKNCLGTLDAGVAQNSLDVNDISNLLISEVKKIKQLADDRLRDIIGLQQSTSKSTEMPSRSVDEYVEIEEASSELSKVNGTSTADPAKTVSLEEFEEFKTKQIEEKNRLRKDRDEYKEKNSKLSGDLTIQKSKVESLEKELNQKKKEVKDLSDKLDNQTSSSASEISELRKDLDKKNKEIQELNKKLTHSTEKGREAAEVLKQLKDENTTLRATEVGQVATKLEEANSKIETLMSNVADHETTIANKNNEIDSLKSTIEQKDQAYKNLTDEKSAVEKKLQEQQSVGQKLQNDLNDANNTIAHQSKELEKQASEIESKNNKIKENESEIKDQQNKLSVLNQNLDESREEIKRQQDIVSSRDKEISNLKSDISSLKADINSLKEELSKTVKTAAKSVDDFHKAIISEAEAALSILNEGQYELGQGEMGETCADDEDGNKRRFNKLVTLLKNIDASQYATIGDLKEALLEVLAEEVNKEAEGIITPLARLCAYSRLPFMRDDQGEDYMVLDPNRLGRLEDHLKNMLGLVGIELIIPTPFCDNVNEGDYEARPGEIPNLDYICPNARQHLDNVDRFNTEDIITDIVCIGYRIPGQATQKAKVIL